MDPIVRFPIEMAEFINPRLLQRLKPLPQLLVTLVILISGLALCSQTLFLFTHEMAPVTAISLILSAAALLLLLSTETPGAKSQIAKTLSGIVTVVGTLSLFGVFRAWSESTVLLHETTGMVPITSLNFVLLGAVLLSYESKPVRTHLVSGLLSVSIALIATLPLIGYVFGAKFALGMGSLSGMAPHTAFSFLMLSVAILLGRPNNGFATVLISDGPGGSMVRHVLPAAIAFPFLLGLMKIVGERSGLFSDELGTALVATLTIGGLGGFIWYRGLVLQRAESKRRSLQRERDSLVLEDRMRNQFVSMLSHDLRTPLAVASAYAQMIRLFPDRHDLTLSHVGKILDSIERTDHMIKDLLNLNRVRAGHSIPISPTECDLSSIIRAIAHELSIPHGDRFRIQGQDELKGVWDSLSIRRAVENLCNNAVKYGSPESKITIHIGRASDRAKISVHNWGPAIPQDEQQNIFEPFHRTSSAETGIKKGWGIGLALVRAIAEAHGGSIRLESSLAHGTEFTIELPAPLDEQFRLPPHSLGADKYA